MLNECKLIEFPQKGDERGTPCHCKKEIRIFPLILKGYFYASMAQIKMSCVEKHANYDTEFVTYQCGRDFQSA